MDRFKPYLCDYDMVTTSDCGNGNMLGSTGIAWALLAMSGEYVSQQDIEVTLLHCRVEPGLYRRRPDGSGGMQSADDYYGLFCGLVLNDLRAEAGEIADYGRNHRWLFNSENPGHLAWSRLWSLKPWGVLSPWFGRFPGFIPSVLYAENKVEPNAFYRMLWRFSLWLAARQPQSNQDAYIQGWERVKIYRASCYRSVKNEISADLFLAKLREHGGLAQFLADYIGNPDHPLVTLAREVA